MKYDTAVYLFYWRYWFDNGYAPTYQEVADGVGIHLLTAHYKTASLIDGGFLYVPKEQKHRGVHVVEYDRRLNLIGVQQSA